MKIVEKLTRWFGPTPTPLYFQPTPKPTQPQQPTNKEIEVINSIETNLNNGASTIPTAPNTWESFKGIEQTEVWTMTKQDELLVIQNKWNRKVYAAIKQLNKRGTLRDGEYVKLGAQAIHKHMRGAKGYSVSNIKKYLSGMNKIGGQATSPIDENKGEGHSRVIVLQ